MFRKAERNWLHLLNQATRPTQEFQMASLDFDLV